MIVFERSLLVFLKCLVAFMCGSSDLVWFFWGFLRIAFWLFVSFFVGSISVGGITALYSENFCNF